MKVRAGVVILSGLVIDVAVWVFAIRCASWAAPITEPLFVPGNLLEFALTPAHAQIPDLWVIILGYSVNFVLTWALMASVVALIIRWISKRRASA